MAKKISLEKIEKIVKEYVQVLETDGFLIEKAILYGSYAKGTPRRDSDIDICLISKKFGKDSHQEGKYLFRKLWDLKNANLEPVGYSPKYFYGKNSSPLVNEIQKHGIELKLK